MRQRSEAISEKAREGQRRRCQRYWAKHPERWREVNSRAHRRYWLKHQDKIRKKRRLKTFGVSEQMYDALLHNQGGVCAICRRKPEEACSRSKYLAIDHDHNTGAIRGLLCHLCNRGIGHFNDVPERLEEAAAYLRKAAQ